MPGAKPGPAVVETVCYFTDEMRHTTFSFNLESFQLLQFLTGRATFE